MTRWVAVMFVSLAVLGSGCLEEDSGTAGAKGKAKNLGKEAASLVGDLMAGAPLWNDPQNAPHAVYGWPTLSSPPEGTDLPAYWGPIAASPVPNPIKGMQAIGQSPPDIRKAGGIAIFGSLLVAPGYGANSAVMDITDPTKPVVLSTFKQQEGMGSHRGATIIAYPGGRLVTVISTGSGLDVWDITDPTHPIGLPPIKVRSHKVGVVPGTPIVYNAKSSGGGVPYGQTAQTATGVTEIYDLSDPANAVKVQDFKNGFSCHHVYFWNNPAQGKYRAICAGLEYTQLWDTKDPLHPTVIVSVPVHHGVANTPSASVPLEAFSHFAGLSQDGKILLVGDENGGGGVPPGCVAEARTPQGSASTPIGALWFYDVSTETMPRLLGWYSPLNDPNMKPAPTTSCTAHHGRIVPAEGRNVIAMSFYGAGVVLVDFTGVGSPGTQPLARVIDQYAAKSDTWETWYNQGYLFTGDLARGVDVLKFR